MEQYRVTGMTCAACQARVEKAVNKVPGVDSCSVSLLTNSMGVEGKASAAEIIAAVEAAGYGAVLKQEKGQESKRREQGSEALSNRKEIDGLKTRLFTSLGFLLALMYFSMGHMMWNWPVPPVLEENHVAMGLIQLLLTGAVMVINQRFFISGFKSLFHGGANMDTLVALGSSAAFVYSTYALFLMTDAQLAGDMDKVMSYMHELYFESAATILTLITVGKMLEARSKGKTTDALKGLMDLSPKTATVVRDGKEETIPVEQVKKGDIFVVRPGETIPVDGCVLEGNSAVNEAALTGESIPVDKEEGDSVSAAALNQSGFIRCEAVRVGEDTTLSQIIQMISDAAATKAPIAKVADRVSGIFVPAVILIALVTLAVWLLVGKGIGYSLARSISVLVISCPCALGLATPVAIMVGNGVGAKHGILVKTAQSLEETGKTEIVVFDKTGTITMGEPEVTDILPEARVSESELLALAFALEKKSEHPLARAILKRGQEEGLEAVTVNRAENAEKEANEAASGEVTDFQALPGNGLIGKLGDDWLKGGNLSFIQKEIPVSAQMREKAGQLSEEGKTPLFFSRNNEFLGIIAVADVIKPDSAEAVAELKNMGIHTVMLTGDNRRTAEAVGKLAGVEDVIADVLPDGKEQVIRSLQEKGKVAMVGDGINDAPALTRADIGIAIGAGTDVAVDAADVVLMRSSLKDVPAVIRLSRATLRNIHENLFWAFFYNVIGIPLAAGVWIPLFGWQLNPMFGAAAMSLSSFCVVSNALRLNLVRLYDSRKDKRRKEAVKRPEKGIERAAEKQEADSTNLKREIERKKNNMEKTIKIEGMMCRNCEAHVKKALEALEGVTAAEASHEEGIAKVSLSKDVPDMVLKDAVEAEGYKALSVS